MSGSFTSRVGQGGSGGPCVWALCRGSSVTASLAERSWAKWRERQEEPGTAEARTKPRTRHLSKDQPLGLPAGHMWPREWPWRLSHPYPLPLLTPWPLGACLLLRESVLQLVPGRELGGAANLLPWFDYAYRTREGVRICVRKRQTDCTLGDS